MSHEISTAFCRTQLLPFIKESFREHHGIFLDKGTSLILTLAEISADYASRPIVDGGATIAGHATHVRFYLRVLTDYMDGQTNGKIDWSQSWLCRQVSQPQWDDLRSGLENDYTNLLDRLDQIDDFSDERQFGGIVAIIAHTAYHLGAIRQMRLVAAK